MVGQYLPQTNEKCYSVLQWPMWLFLPLFTSSKHSLKSRPGRIRDPVAEFAETIPFPSNHELRPGFRIMFFFKKIPSWCKLSNYPSIILPARAFQKKKTVQVYNSCSYRSSWQVGAANNLGSQSKMPGLRDNGAGHCARSDHTISKL